MYAWEKPRRNWVTQPSGRGHLFKHPQPQTRRTLGIVIWGFKGEEDNLHRDGMQMFVKQVLLGQKMGLLVCFYHTYFTSYYSYHMAWAPSWDRPSMLNTFWQLEERSKFLSESFVLKNNQAKETYFEVANSDPPTQQKWLWQYDP